MWDLPSGISECSGKVRKENYRELFQLAFPEYHLSFPEIKRHIQWKMQLHFHYKINRDILRNHIKQKRLEMPEVCRFLLPASCEL